MALTETQTHRDRPDDGPVADGGSGPTGTRASSSSSSASGTTCHRPPLHRLLAAVPALASWSPVPWQASTRPPTTASSVSPTPCWTSSLVALVLMGALPLLLGLAICIVPLQVGSPGHRLPPCRGAVAVDAGSSRPAIFVTRRGARRRRRRHRPRGRPAGQPVPRRDDGRPLARRRRAWPPRCCRTARMGMGLAQVPVLRLVDARRRRPCGSSPSARAIAHVVLGQISQADAAAPGRELRRRHRVVPAGAQRLHAGHPRPGHRRRRGRRARPAAASRHYGLVQGIIGAYAVFSFGAWTQSPASLQTFVWIAVRRWPSPCPVRRPARRPRRHPAPRQGHAVGRADRLAPGGPADCWAAWCAALLQALDTAGTGTLFGFERRGARVAPRPSSCVAAALGGALAGLAHWSRQVWGGPVPESTGKASRPHWSSLGGGLLATVPSLVEVVVQAGRQVDRPSQLFGGLDRGRRALLALVGSPGAGLPTLGAAQATPPRPTEECAGLTLEWAFPASGRGRRRRRTTCPRSNSPVPAARRPRVTTPTRRTPDGRHRTCADCPGAAQPRRRRELLFGTAFATAGVVMAMLTLIGAYLAARNAAGAAVAVGEQHPADPAQHADARPRPCRWSPCSGRSTRSTATTAPTPTWRWASRCCSVRRSSTRRSSCTS